MNSFSFFNAKKCKRIALLSYIRCSNPFYIICTLLLMVCSYTSYAQFGKIDLNRYQANGIAGSVHDVIVLPDSSIVVVGAITHSNGQPVKNIIKLKKDGSNDATFNTNIGTGTNGTITTIALQSDGKFLIGGGFSTFNGVSRNRIARLNSDGTLDTSFSPGTGFNNTVTEILIQNDGLIMAVGSFGSYNGANAYYAVRINSNGTRDNTFNAVSAYGLNAIVRQSDGKYIVGGQSHPTYKTVRRLNINGSIDTSFTSGTTTGSGIITANDIEILSNGKICIGGAFATYNGISTGGLAIINPNGTVSSSFVAGGAGTINDIKESNGKIILAGIFNIYKTTNANSIVAIDTNGLVDTTFKTGQGCTDQFLSYLSVKVVKPYMDGFIVGGDFIMYNGYNRHRLVRISANGSIDKAFHKNSGFNSFLNTVAVQDDGKAIVGGGFVTCQTDSAYRIARLLVNGEIDPSFNTGSGFDNQVYSLKILTNGKVLVGGVFTKFNGNTANRVACLNSDGSFDNTFVASANGTVYDIETDEAGKIYLAGNFTTINASSKASIVRLNADGSIDNTFLFKTVSSNALTVKIQSDDKILVGGGAFTYSGVSSPMLMRVKTDTNLDTTFTQNGSPNNIVWDIDLTSDGKILIGGSFTTYKGVTRGYVARLMSDGQLDNTFNCNAIGVGPIYDVKQYDKGVLAAGTFNTSSNITRGIIYLDSTGVRDTSFMNPSTSDATFTVKKIFNDKQRGKLHLAGMFLNYQTYPTPYYVVLNGRFGSDENVIDSISMDSVLCERDSSIVRFKKVKTFNTGNTFTVQLSNSSGSFISPTTIGAKVAEGNGWEEISVFIPNSMAAGSGYKIRIVATNTPYTSGILPVNVAAAVDTADIVGDSSIYLGMEPCYIATATNSTSITYSILGDGASIDSPGCVYDVTRSFAVVATAIGNPACPATIASKYVQVVNEQLWPQELIEYCANDRMVEGLRQSMPEFDVEREYMEEIINNYLDSLDEEGEGDRGGGNFIIPVVFHVVHQQGQAEGTGQNLSYEQLQWQIRALNAAFGMYYPEYNGQSHDATAHVTNIQFCLATIPAGTTWSNPAQPGVMRYPTTNTNQLIVNAPNPDLNDFSGVTQLLALTHPNATVFPFNRYLNIWSVQNINGNVAGLGTPPRPTGTHWPMDGVLMVANILGDNTIPGNNFPMSPVYQQGKILAHEVGHYFNLLHTFQPTNTNCTITDGTCAGAGAVGSGCNSCSSNGDNVCDIPPCRPLVNAVDLENCNFTTNTCTGLNDYPSHNYMTYKADNCLNAFTSGQVNRMNALLVSSASNRFNLCQPANLLATAPQCEECIFTANIDFAPASPCPGTQIDFSTPQGDSFCATSWSWQFPGATPSTSTQQNPQNIVYANPGVYTVTLTATSGTNTIVKSEQINIISRMAQITHPTETIDACNGSLQTIKFQFTNGQPPYNYTLSNGTSFQTNFARYNHVITVGNNDEAITITSASDNTCAASPTGIANFNVVDCCPSILTNGNFTNGDEGFDSEHNDIPDAHGTYSIVLPGAGSAISQNFGRVMYIDGFAIPPHTVPDNFSVIWEQNVTLLSNTEYNIDFLTTAQGVPTPPAPPTLGDPPLILRVVLLNSLGNEVFSTDATGDFVVDFTNPNNFNGGPLNWTFWCQNRVRFNSASLSGNYTISIRQVDNFDGTFMDYWVDEITMRAWMPVFEELAGTNYMICNGNNPHIGFASGTDHYDYTWSPSSGLSCTTCPNPIASAANTYTVSVTPEAGNTCPAREYEVDVAVANISINGSVTNKICATNTGAVNITPSGGVGPYTYQWSGPSSFNATTEDISNRPAGTYNVTATDANGCSGTASYTISQVYYFVNVTGTASNTLCSGSTGAVNITPSGGTAPYTYSWTGPGGYTANTEDISNRPAGTYEVSVTDVYGCGGTGSFTINASYSSISIAASVSNTVCTANTGSVNITASAGTLPYTYAWAGPGGYTAITEDINNRPAGIYNVTVTDINGCSGTATFTINTANAIINVTGVVTNTNCSSNTGAVNASVSGGTTPYTYAWSGPSSYTATTQDISGRAAGTYTLVVTDASGCTASASFTINTTFPVTETHTASLCAGTDHGFIDITPNGTAPYTYNWGGGITTQDRTDLVAGTYTVVITDANGCQATVSVTIASNNNCCGGDYYPIKGYDDELTFNNITSSQLATMMNLPSSGGVFQLALGSAYQIAFNGTFTIDNNFLITGCTDVTFGPGASIQVQAGKTLSVFGSTLYACDNFLWRGINVVATGNFKIAQSSILDAQYAINANNGSIISVANTTFIENYVGMFVHQANTGVFSLPTINLQMFRGNRFLGGSLLSPYPSMAMIEPNIQPSVGQMQSAGHSWTGILVNNISLLNLISGTTVNDRTVYSGLTSGSPDNRLANGIVSRASSLNVGNSHFLGLMSYGYNFNQNLIRYQGNGIIASGTNVAPTLMLPQRTLTQTGMGQNLFQDVAFAGSEYGIVADRMNLRTSNNLIFATNGNRAGIRAINCRFSNVRIWNNTIHNNANFGIEYDQADPSTGFEIRNNTMLTSANGIRLNQISVPNSQNGILRSNPVQMGTNGFIGMFVNSSTGVLNWNPFTQQLNSNFQISSNPITLTSPTTNLIGLNITGCQSIIDRENDIRGVDNDVVANSALSTFPTGYNYGTNTSIIHRCNVVRNLNYGFKFFGQNGGTSFQGNYMNSVTGDELNFGLHYSSGTQINPQLNARNRWLQTFNTRAALNSNTSNFNAQRIVVANSTAINPYLVSPSPPLGPVLPLGNWVTTLGGTTTAEICAQPLTAPNDYDGVLDDYEIDVINNNISSERYNDELKWQATKHVYSMLKADTTVLDSTANGRLFFTTVGATPIAELVNVEQLQQQAMKMDEDIVLVLTNVQDSIDTLINRIIILNEATQSLFDTTVVANDSLVVLDIIQAIESAYRDTTSTRDSIVHAYVTEMSDFEARWITDTLAHDSLLAEINRYVEDITELQFYADSVKHGEDSLRMLRVLSVISVNNSIITTNDIEEGYKVINDIYLQTIGLEDTLFDSTQLAYLYHYAFMCPLEGGEATYRARAMLDLVIDTVYLDELYCVSNDSLRALRIPVKDKQKGNKTGISDLELNIAMYPNPASNYVTLEANKEIQGQLILNVTDALGKTILSLQVNMVGGKYNLDTHNLINGIYFVSLHDNGSKIFGAKLSIFK